VNLYGLRRKERSETGEVKSQNHSRQELVSAHPRLDSMAVVADDCRQTEASRVFLLHALYQLHYLRRYGSTKGCKVLSHPFAALPITGKFWLPSYQVLSIPSYQVLSMSSWRHLKEGKTSQTLNSPV
jgi:hypothetical protein